MKIGKGLYGDVFYPPLECIHDDIDERYEKGISKLMNDEDAVDEYNKLEFLDLDKLDPEFKFHLKKPLLRKTKKKENGKEYLLIYDYGGKSLKDIFNDENEKIEDIMLGLKNILQWIVILNKNKIYHLDIKGSNILVNENNKYLLIDYGVSEKIKEKYIDLKDNFSIYCSYGFPIEYCCVSRSLNFHNGKKADYKYFKGFMNEKLYDEYIEFRLNKKNQFPEDSLSDAIYYSNFFEYNIDDINKTKKFLLQFDEEEQIKKVLEKYDVFSFGIIMIHLLWKIKQKKIEYSKYDLLFEYIKNLISCDIEKRYDAEKAYSEFEKLFP